MSTTTKHKANMFEIRIGIIPGKLIEYNKS